MNKFIFMLALCLSLAAYGTPSTLPNAGEETQTASSQEKDTRVEVLCFHTKKRCVTCTAIEKNAQETVETLFAEEVKTGRVVFKTIDLSLEENKKIAERYQVAWSSLIVSHWKDGKERYENLTLQAFATARTAPEKFKKELAEKISALLKS